MPRLSSLLPLLAVLALPIASSGCTKPSHADERAPSAAVPTALGSASTAQPLPEPRTEIAGDLRPIQAANLSFKTGGRLASLSVARGDRVKKGQVLATLADPEARAAVAQADAAVKVARAQAAIAEDAEKRAEQLGSAAVVPASAVVTATLSADAARAGVQQALAAASLARANLANHVLAAPFDGIVVLVPDGSGETVGAGIPVMRLENLETLVLRATASERELDRIKVGDEIAIETSSGKRAVGKVRAVVGSLEPVSRRAPIEIVVPNHDGQLSAGAYVRAWIPADVANEGAQP